MKKLFITVFVVVFSISLFCQNTNFFIGSGTTYLTDFGKTPVKVMEGPLGDFGLEGDLYYTRLFYWAPLSKSFILRYNIHEFNADKALAVDVFPSVSISFFKECPLVLLCSSNLHGLLSVNIPVYLSYESGLGSTLQTEEISGYSLGVGVEFNRAPIIDDGRYDIYKLNWFQPVALVGVRYWNKRYILKEINFKLGFGIPRESPKYDFFQFVSSDDEIIMGKSSSFTFRLTWIRYIKY
ncbi:MAG: hypothetical protein C0596_11465 [Marinilabiliales bacterium]|nr:MAG: hypothetical protein C0596_11465 [Marinilabiliales bacterium]